MNKYLSIGTKSFPYLKVLYDFFLEIIDPFDLYKQIIF